MPTQKRSRVAHASDRARLSQPALANRIGSVARPIARVEADGASPRVESARGLTRARRER
jgi:ribosome-binding protein aMBF1 (putative translation factor)